jgi:hypothetical protein
MQSTRVIEVEVVSEQSVPPRRVDGQKRPYAKPQLVSFGSLQELTLGHPGFQHADNKTDNS